MACRSTFPFLVVPVAGSALFLCPENQWQQQCAQNPLILSGGINIWEAALSIKSGFHMPGSLKCLQKQVMRQKKTERMANKRAAFRIVRWLWCSCLVGSVCWWEMICHVDSLQMWVCWQGLQEEQCKQREGPASLGVACPYWFLRFSISVFKASHQTCSPHQLSYTPHANLWQTWSYGNHLLLLARVSQKLLSPFCERVGRHRP